MTVTLPNASVRVDSPGYEVYKLPQEWEIVVSDSLYLLFSDQAGQTLKVKSW